MRDLLALDGVVAETLAAGVATQIVSIDAVPEDKMVLDVNPLTVEAMARSCSLWAGLEWAARCVRTDPFDAGTTHWPRRRGDGPGACCPWRAAAIRLRHWHTPVCWSGSATFRPRAALSWSGWKARICRAWRCYAPESKSVLCGPPQALHFGDTSPKQAVPAHGSNPCVRRGQMDAYGWRKQRAHHR